ncbi:MMPL family transporter [Angustibacter sp. McL0619]|uniref:MMPL family transporter n=1 Tax=Angustibacter sp. McL0619 TaxID=3415676 RepID=UPI003CFBA518
MLSHALYRLGRATARRPLLVIGSWLLLAVVVVGGASTFGQKLEDSFRVPGLDSQQANDLLAATGSGQAGLTAQVVATPRTADATFTGSATARTALADLQSAAAALPHVLSTSQEVSPDGRVALLRLQYPLLDQLSVQDLDNLKAMGANVSADSALRVEMGGDLFFAFESATPGIAKLVGIVLAFVILFLAFGSFVAAALPIGTAVLGLAVGTGAIPLLANAFDVPSYAPVLGAMVGLGVGIDYALFVVTRHREYLSNGADVDESVGRALARAGQPVVFAGGIVVVSMLGLAVARVPFMTAGGIAISLVVLVMVAASVTLLPAFLGLAGHRVHALGERRTGRITAPTGPGWERWVRHVCRHPWIYLVGVSTLLMALAAPVLALRVGIPDDGALPPTYTQRQAFDLVASGFGPGRNGPVVVAVDLHGDDAVVGRLAAAIEADPGIAGVGAPSVNDVKGIATVVAFPTSGPQQRATYDTVERLRSVVFPAVLAGSPARAHIGGQTANFADVGARVNSRLPVLIAAVLGMSFLLLMLVFRSVLVPLKAVLLNLLSIGASYGVMVMVFQWGWAGGLIGLESTVPIVSFIPMFMFAILFGLSMDYEVFLLSRVREEYVASGDNEESVVRGIAGTGRVITSAALIMVCVFMAFVLGKDSATKMFGLGLATAIAVDATLVRMVLVPAAMKLLGDANWWFPQRFRPAAREVAAASADPGFRDLLTGPVGNA